MTDLEIIMTVLLVMIFVFDLYRISRIRSFYQNRLVEKDLRMKEEKEKDWLQSEKLCTRIRELDEMISGQGNMISNKDEIINNLSKEIVLFESDIKERDLIIKEKNDLLGKHIQHDKSREKYLLSIENNLLHSDLTSKERFYDYDRFKGIVEKLREMESSLNVNINKALNERDEALRNYKSIDQLLARSGQSIIKLQQENKEMKSEANSNAEALSKAKETKVKYISLVNSRNSIKKMLKGTDYEELSPAQAIKKMIATIKYGKK